MKKGFLSVLLTLGMVLIMLPTTAYADSTWCDTCNKRVTVRYEYEYKDAQWHWNHTYCLECGKNTSNPRTKHQWSGTATCTSGRICTICGGTSNPLGHAYESSVTTKPTCTTGGVRTYVCKNDSSHTYTEPIPAAHDWNSIWFSDEDNHWHECNVCAEKGDVGIHIWDNGTITISPTCTTEGERKYTCIGCGRIKTETIQATGHDLVHHDAQAATCTANGWETYDTCSNCDYTTYTEIPAVGHSYGDVTYTWSTDNQHCTAERKCTACDGVESETADTTATVIQEKNCVLPELTTYSVTFENSAFESQTKENVRTAENAGHDMEKVEKQAATAAKEGNSTYWFCDKCNKYFSDEEAENEIKKEDTVLAKLAPVIIKGDGATVTAGAKNALSFTSDAAYRDFIRVEVDGKTIDESNYTVESGSIIVTLKEDYVAGFSKGEHTLGIVSESGTATAHFTVNEKTTGTQEPSEDTTGTTQEPSEDTTSTTQEPSKDTTNKTQETSTTDKTTQSSPKTGDSTDLQLYVILMFVSIVGVAGICVKKRFKTH